MPGLPWLERLNEAIEQAGQTEVPFAVAIFDLDGFKLTNALLGARKADDKLKETARVLLEQTREGQQSAVIAVTAIGRMGGDEFAMLLHKFGLDQPSDKAAEESDKPGVAAAEGVPQQRRTGHFAAFGAKVKTAVKRIEEDISTAIADPGVPRLKATGDYVVWEPGMTAEDLLDLVDRKAHMRKFAQIQEMFTHMTSEQLDEYVLHATYLREVLKVDYRVIPLPGEQIDP